MTTSYPLSLISAYLDTDTLSSYKKNTFKQLNGSPAGVGYPILSLAIFSLTVTPCLTILFNSVSIYNNPLILNNIKEGSIDYLFTDTYIASLPLASLCCSILAIYQSDLILCDEEGSDDTDKDNKYATYLFLDQAINSFLLKTFWLNYFILFRLVANNALHPYNFVQKVIKVSCFIQVISNRASDNIYLVTSFLIYNITIISFLYYYKVYYDIKPPGFVKIEIEIFDEL